MKDETFGTVVLHEKVYTETKNEKIKRNVHFIVRQKAFSLRSESKKDIKIFLTNITSI